LVEFGDAGMPRESAYARMWPDADLRRDREVFWRPMRDLRNKLCEALDRPARISATMVPNLGASTYRINAALFGCDVWRLREALADARGCTGSAQAAALLRAAELYTGTYLPGCEYDFARNAAVAIDREVVRALVQLAELQDDPEAALVYLERASAIDTLDEYLYRRRMELHAGVAQVHAIRCCYDELRAHLRELDLDPDPRTTALVRRLAG
jgi:two-component SAPR family response regulator